MQGTPGRLGCPSCGAQIGEADRCQACDAFLLCTFIGEARVDEVLAELKRWIPQGQSDIDPVAGGTRIRCGLSLAPRVAGLLMSLGASFTFALGSRAETSSAPSAAPSEAPRPPRPQVKRGLSLSAYMGITMLLLMCSGLGFWFGSGGPWGSARKAAPQPVLAEAPEPDAAMLTFTKDAGAPIIPKSRADAVDQAVIKAGLAATIHVKTPLSEGSGFFISKEGFALTNAHVVSNATKAEVRTHDDEIFEAEVVARSTAQDLAVLKLKVKKGQTFTAAPIGQASNLEHGDQIFITGAPLGLDFTVSRGYISNPLRWLAGKPCLQVDVPINRGNSGGPAFDSKGNVIGINTYKAAFAEGVGYSHFIDAAIQGDDAIVAPFIGKTPKTEGFVEVLKKREEGRRHTDDPERAFDEIKDLIVVGPMQWQPSNRRCPTRRRSREWIKHCRGDLLFTMIRFSKESDPRFSRQAELHFLEADHDFKKDGAHIQTYTSGWEKISRDGMPEELKEMLDRISNGVLRINIYATAAVVKGPDLERFFKNNQRSKRRFIMKIGDANSPTLSYHKIGRSSPYIWK